MFTAQYSGFVNSEDSGVLSGAPDFNTPATTNSPVDGSPYLITLDTGTLGADNYSFTFVDGSLTVTQAVLTVTADNQVKAFGAAVPLLTVSYNGFVNGDDTNVLSGAPGLSTAATNSSP